MTRTTNSRIAGVAFLLYIAAGIASLIVFGKAAAGDGIAAKLAAMAQHVTDVRVVVVLSLVQCFCALTLAVSLWAITREQDADLAMMGMICRVGEGLIGAAGIPGTLYLLWLATATGADAPDPAAAHAIAQYVLKGSEVLSALFFAVGSTIFSWLLLRGRMIPMWMAWLGVAASVLLVVVLPLQLAGFIAGSALIWLPMLAFEVPLAFWLMIKGAAAPAERMSPR